MASRDRWAVGAYGGFEQPDGGDFKLMQTRLVTRYRLFSPGKRYFDAALYFEYHVPRESYQGDNKDILETRVMLERNYGN